MNTAARAWLIAAAVLTVLGLLLFVGVMTVYGWNFTRLSTVQYTTNAHAITGDFTHISIRVHTAQVSLLPTTDGSCRVVCLETEKVQHTATVQDNTLVIDTLDTRKWYEYIGVFFNLPKVTVYLPQDAYTSLQIETDTGDITVPAGFSFGSIEINGDTADVDCFAAASDSLNIQLSTGGIHVGAGTAGQLHLATTTGNIRVNTVAVEDAVNIKTNTGTVNFADVSCAALTAESDTGNITLHGVAAAGSLSVKSDTGNVRLENSDAARISVKTHTGNVTGTLLSEKVFTAESSTGTVSVPKTAAGGQCEITTDTGNITIAIGRAPS